MLTHFRLEEFNCTHTNANLMDEAFLHKLDELRENAVSRLRLPLGTAMPRTPVKSSKPPPVQAHIAKVSRQT